jgi:hypothetical protein
MKAKNILLWLLVAVLGLLATLFIVSGIFIGTGVKEIADEAQKSFPGDTVESLMLLMDSENQPMGTRNKAVWALGQLGEKKALPYLEKHYTGEPCDHSRFLCQYELKKAIKHCRGDLNITAWMWRRFVD